MSGNSWSLTFKVLGLVLLVGFATISPAAAVSSARYEKQVNVETNRERTSRDLSKLRTKKCVDRYAERQARRMAKNRSLEHQALGPILKKCTLSRVAENIALGYPTADDVVDAWMHSPGHRRNILTKKMRYIGVGAVRDSDGHWWVSQVFGARK